MKHFKVWLQLSTGFRLVAGTTLRLLCGRVLGGSLALLILDPSFGLQAQEPSPAIPDVTSIREIRFRAPGCGAVRCGDARTNERAMALLAAGGKAWRHQRETPHAEFVFEIHAGKQTPVVIRAGRMDDRAFLQIAEAGNGFHVRDITVSELSRLLELFHCDASVAFLLHDKGYYREVIDKALSSQNCRVSSRDMDAGAARRILESIVQYARSHPQDTSVTEVLRTLLSLSIDDFVPGWYTVQLAGCGYHCFSRNVVSRDGKSMPASSRNCLSLCEGQFGSLDELENARSVCAKVLEGSDLGIMVDCCEEIPGYRTRPTSPEKEREIRPICDERTGGRLTYTFYVYHRMGGCVRRCELTVQDDVTAWETRDFAKGVGDGWGLPVE